MGILGRLREREGRAAWRLSHRVLDRLGFVRPPEAVQWISTSMCELRCAHCYSEAGKSSEGELTTDEVRRLLVDELVLLGSPVLVIAGGEALLRRDLPEVIEYVHERQVPWALHTHGGWVERNAELFRRCPPLMVAVSLDGPPEHHDAFRGRPGSHAAALRAMQVLKEVGVPEVVAGTTVTRQNADLLLDMLPTIRSSAADSWGLHLVTPEGRAGRHPELLPTPDQIRRAASIARRLRGLVHVELDNEWGSAGDDDCFYRDDAFMCGAGRFSCVVSATGELMPCTTTDARESQGNVRERPLHRLWVDGFAPFRRLAGDERADCQDCWLQTRNGCSVRESAFAGARARAVRS